LKNSRYSPYHSTEFREQPAGVRWASQHGVEQPDVRLQPYVPIGVEELNDGAARPETPTADFQNVAVRSASVPLQELKL